MMLMILLFSAAVSAGEVAGVVPGMAHEGSAPAFKLVSVDGKAFEYPRDAGTGPVVVNFFATWCTTCEEEIPQLQELKSKYPAATYLGINAGESQKKIRKFMMKYSYPWPVLLDEDKSIAKAFGVFGLPMTFVIDRNQKILFRGTRPPKEIPKHSP